MYKEKIINLVDGSEIFRDYTPEEIALVDAENERIAKLNSEKESKEKAKLEILEKLGLTADEAAALLG